MTRKSQSHRTFIGAMIVVLLGLGAALLPQGGLAAEEPGDDALKQRFEYSSENGNSNCSREFMDSIAMIPADPYDIPTGLAQQLLPH
jgi:hypothetical protein